MNIIKFRIDEKSLYYGIHNDYVRGQTPTVNTPINQAKDPKNWRKDIVKFLDCGLEEKNIPKRLRELCSSKTTSQSDNVITKLFVFDNIALDGIPLVTASSFAIYAKEEISEYIKNRKGNIVKNTHKGRIKLHYPSALKYLQDGFEIDNKDVLNCILEQNRRFAFVVRGFEVDVENKRLNFITSLVGFEGIYLSTVFKRQKGVGKKLLLEEIDPDLLEEITYQLGSSKTKNVISSDDNPSSYEEVLDKINKTRKENGNKGEEYVMNHIKDIIGEDIKDVYHTSKDYPTSPYDIEYIQNGVKKYLEVKATSGDKKIFNMSKGEIRFMNEYEHDYLLILLTNINDKFPKINIYTKNNVSHMKKDYPKVVFTAG